MKNIFNGNAEPPPPGAPPPGTAPPVEALDGGAVPVTTGAVLEFAPPAGQASRLALPFFTKGFA